MGHTSAGRVCCGDEVMLVACVECGEVVLGGCVVHGWLEVLLGDCVLHPHCCRLM